MKTEYQVAIVGAGPAGIAAATALRQVGIEDVVILEREQQAGGVPRHCRHPTFGLQTFYRPMLGSTYVDKILARAGRVEICTGVTVLAIKPDGELTITDRRGVSTLKAQRVILATGVRETPRHPRLVSGLRPQGVLTAGALQQFVYLRGLQPGKAPVVVGTELVSFSALWTLRNAGVRAVAMIESGGRPVAWRLSALYARLMGVPIHYYSRVTDIAGRDRVESIEVENRQGEKRRIACDSLIFTGRFTGEYTLIRQSHLAQRPDNGCPLTDQFGRCSDAAYFAVGNMLHPADMGDQCYQEGLRVGEAVARSLQRTLPPARQILPVRHDERIRLTAPANVALIGKPATVTINMRVEQPVSGSIVVRLGENVLYRKTHRCLPERRILLRNIALPADGERDVLHISIEPAG